MLIYLEDKKLAKRLLRGDQRSFEQFFNENFSRLYRFALARMSGDREATREEAAEQLRQVGVTPLVREDRPELYFKDPDGITVQLSAKEYRG